MLRGLKKMTKHRKADGLRCWHFWDGPQTTGWIFSAWGAHQASYSPNKRVV